MTNAKNTASRVRECPDCKGRQFREYCPPRGKGWCAPLGWCRTCMGLGYVGLPTAREVVSRIVRRHTPPENEDDPWATRCAHYEGKAQQLCESGRQEL